jgi:hypothetical protein
MGRPQGLGLSLYLGQFCEAALYDSGVVPSLLPERLAGTAQKKAGLE